MLTISDDGAGPDRAVLLKRGRELGLESVRDGRGVVVFDYDNDGDLDLFVGNYVRWSKEIDFAVDYRLVGVGRAYGPPMNFEGSHPYLYRNNGDGTFEEVAAETGLHVNNPATGRPMGKALGVAPVASESESWRRPRHRGRCA